MASPAPPTASTSKYGSVRAGLAAHVLLAGSMALARASGSGALPAALSGPQGGLVGEAFLAVWALVLVAALGLAALVTLRTRHPALLVLALGLGLSLAQRRTFDAFDLVYLLAVPLVVALAVARASTRGRLPHPADGRARGA